jgi:rhodanese-related sulfurtransferase
MKNKIPDAKKAKRYFARKLAFTTGPIELSHWLKDRKDIKVVDVRDSKSYAKGHIPGAVNLPKEKWHKLTPLDKNKANIVYCYSQVCHLAAHAALDFASAGYPVIELEGGYDTWKAYKLPTEKKAAHHARKADKAVEAKEDTEAPVEQSEPQEALATQTA